MHLARHSISPADETTIKKSPLQDFRFGLRHLDSLLYRTPHRMYCVGACLVSDHHLFSIHLNWTEWTELNDKPSGRRGPTPRILQISRPAHVLHPATSCVSQGMYPPGRGHAQGRGMLVVVHVIRSSGAGTHGQKSMHAAPSLVSSASCAVNGERDYGIRPQPIYPSTWLQTGSVEATFPIILAVRYPARPCTIS